jgi:hypothetical protein
MTTRLYIYAITDATMPIDDVRGVAGEALRVIDSLAAYYIIAGDLTGRERPIATRESLVAQDTLVRTLATRAAAVLPMRFGTTFDDDLALAKSLNRLDATRVREALSRVRGCEQMTLRLLRTSAAPHATTPEGGTGTGSGTAYLQARAAAVAHSPLQLPQMQALRQQLADITRDERTEPAPAARAPLVASIYHLIARGDESRYHAIVGAWLPPDDLTVRLSGPAPPYAFAKDALS